MLINIIKRRHHEIKTIYINKKIKNRMKEKNIAKQQPNHF